MQLKYIDEINKFFIYNEKASKNVELLVDVISESHNLSVKLFETALWSKIGQPYESSRIDYVCRLNSINNSSQYDVTLSPIAKKHKFIYKYDKNENNRMIYTTQGQLLFFKWAIKSGFYSFVTQNINRFNVPSKYNKDDFDRIFDGFDGDKKIEKICNENQDYNIMDIIRYSYDDPGAVITLTL